VCRGSGDRRRGVARPADDGVRAARVVLLLAQLAALRSMASKSPLARSPASPCRQRRGNAAVGQTRGIDGDVDRGPAVFGGPCRTTLGRGRGNDWIGGGRDALDPARRPHRARALNVRIRCSARDSGAGTRLWPSTDSHGRCEGHHTARFVGRGDWIRTSDPSVPNRVLYQTEPRPDELLSVTCPQCRFTNTLAAAAATNSSN
jgi:hypothetical protein